MIFRVRHIEYICKEEEKIHIAKKILKVVHEDCIYYVLKEKCFLSLLWFTLFRIYCFDSQVVYQISGSMNMPNHSLNSMDESRVFMYCHQMTNLQQQYCNRLIVYNKIERHTSERQNCKDNLKRKTKKNSSKDSFIDKHDSGAIILFVLLYYFIV